MREVAIIGVGCSKFGELWDMGFRDIVISAGIEALEDAGLEGREIEAVYAGNMSAGRYIGQEHIASLIADYSGLADLHIPCVRVEAGDASGGVALRQAYMAVASGVHDIVIAAGAEKVTDVPNAMEILSASADVEWEVFNGANLPALYAMIARMHMKKFGTKEEDLAMISVKNHKNATLNPKAMFRREISLDVALNSPYVAEPLKLFDCSPICDGASVVVLASEDVAKKYTDTPIYIKACTQASDYMALQSRRDITTMDAVVFASREAYRIAKIEPNDVDFAEVHDSFTIAEIIAYEDLGFAKKGEGSKLIREEVTALDGDLPVNTSGGLKAFGHAVGATGVRQAVEIALQLRGDAGKRQVDAEIGLSLNIGGTGATAVVTIFAR